MSEEKTFPTEDVLSTVTGRLVSKIDGVYQVLNWMTGESVYTHQIPRISREARPVLLARHPGLQAACDEADQVNRENWQEWQDRWKCRYGATLPVPKFAAAEHEPIDPVSEAAEHIHPDNILTVSAGEKP